MTLRFVGLALKFVMQNDGDSVEITLIYSQVLSLTFKLYFSSNRFVCLSYENIFDLLLYFEIHLS